MPDLTAKQVLDKLKKGESLERVFHSLYQMLAIARGLSQLVHAFAVGEELLDRLEALVEIRWQREPPSASTGIRDRSHETVDSQHVGAVVARREFQRSDNGVECILERARQAPRPSYGVSRFVRSRSLLLPKSRSRDPAGARERERLAAP